MRLKPCHPQLAKPSSQLSATEELTTNSTTPLDQAFHALIQNVHATQDHSVLRLPDSAKKMGRANSTFWQDVKNGIAPPPIRVGKRSVGWLSAELDAVLAARALSSRTNRPLDIKVFVSQLVSPRQHLKTSTL
nr:AlpA family phage regulatory protein [uncultured Duganella sp.]